mmetsp:Transcript_80384/g.260450  ORF Transcript_80384/g.260450 Transcript_80384/m.260450 type:complete len:255 (+) Transcript_80384:1682-2446(+)
MPCARFGQQLLPVVSQQEWSVVAHRPPTAAARLRCTGDFSCCWLRPVNFWRTPSWQRTPLVMTPLMCRGTSLHCATSGRAASTWQSIWPAQLVEVTTRTLPRASGGWRSVSWPSAPMPTSALPAYDSVNLGVMRSLASVPLARRSRNWTLQRSLWRSHPAPPSRTGHPAPRRALFWPPSPSGRQTSCTSWPLWPCLALCPVQRWSHACVSTLRRSSGKPRSSRSPYQRSASAGSSQPSASASGACTSSGHCLAR